jgi:hypothetical protein
MPLKKGDSGGGIEGETNLTDGGAAETGAVGVLVFLVLLRLFGGGRRRPF